MAQEMRTKFFRRIILAAIAAVAVILCLTHFHILAVKTQRVITLDATPPSDMAYRQKSSLEINVGEEQRKDENVLDTEVVQKKEENVINTKEVPVSTASKPLNRTVNWTVLITINKAFFDFYQNWLWHFQQLHLPENVSVIVIAEDDEVYEKARELKTPSVTVKKSHMEHINTSLVFNTPLFKKYMARRAVYILEYLQQGNDILHVDVDSVWLKNPFPYLVGNFDIWAQADNDNGVICIGFIALKSKYKVINFVKQWIEVMQSKKNTKADQNVFNEILRPRKNLRIKRLPSVNFPFGKLYFEKMKNEDRAKTIVVHNNWIIGHDKKLDRFKKFKLWRV